MSMQDKKIQKLICGLDIGTTKVTFAISGATSQGLEIFGLGVAPSSGVRHGTLINIEATTVAIKKAREEAELMAGLKANKVWLAIGGTHIQSFDSSGMVAIRNREVTQEDIDRVVEAAKAVVIPSDRQVLHVLTKDFKVDGQEGIADPVGMSGVRLEASVHIITGNRAIVQNTMKCVERADIEVAGLVLTPLASAMSVLSDDEKNLGVTVVDIGGGTCEMITFIRNSATHTACIPVGGNNFTHDVALGLRTTQNNAESIKKKYGHALAEVAGADETLEVESVGGRAPRTVARSSLCEVLEARAEETLKLIKKEIEEKGFVGRLGSGVVLTGGGSELKGLVEMADFLFDMPAKMGLPVRIGGLADVVSGAQFSTVVGLLLYGFEKDKSKIIEAEEAQESAFNFNDWGRRIKNYFANW